PAEARPMRQPSDLPGRPSRPGPWPRPPQDPERPAPIRRPRRSPAPPPETAHRAPPRRSASAASGGGPPAGARGKRRRPLPEYARTRRARRAVAAAADRRPRLGSSRLLHARTPTPSGPTSWRSAPQSSPAVSRPGGGRSVARGAAVPPSLGVHRQTPHYDHAFARVATPGSAQRCSHGGGPDDDGARSRRPWPHRDGTSAGAPGAPRSRGRARANEGYRYSMPCALRSDNTEV